MNRAALRTALIVAVIVTTLVRAWRRRSHSRERQPGFTEPTSGEATPRLGAFDGSDVTSLEGSRDPRGSRAMGSPSDRQIQGTAFVVLVLVATAVVAGATWRSLAPPIAEQTADVASTPAATTADQPTSSIRITIEPGWRAEEVALALDQTGAADPERLLALVREPALAGGIDESLRQLPSLEGYLHPGTYEFATTASEASLLREMTQRSVHAFTPDMRARARELTLTEHQVVTLASIVQREMVLVSEGPVIAGVFHDRLNAGIRLQSDPTVAYVADSERGPASTGYWRRAITANDLRLESAYNTYTNAGIPPGPIASPSREAIRAVLYPADLGYRYFVARGNGTHAFSPTLDEHLGRVAEFREPRAAAAESSTTLQQLIERVLAPVAGHVGVVVKNLATGETAALNSEEFFTTASLYKLAVLVAAFDRRERNQLSFDERLELSPETINQDPPPLRAQLDNSTTVAQAIEEMVVVSSNPAALALLGRLGRSEIESVLRRYGVNNTALTSRPLLTTPQDMARLLELVAEGRAVSAQASSEMASLLERQQINNRLPKYLPPGARLAHKTGDLVGLRHDAGILYLADGPIVILAMTEGVLDEDAASEAIAQLGRAVHTYFDDYVPAREAFPEGPGRACVTAPPVRTVPGALSDRTIVVDPGHGGPDGGTRFDFADGRVLEEKEVTLAVALRLRDLLVRQGASIHLTRCADVPLLQAERAVIANAAVADASVSVHVNGSEEPSADGTAVFHVSDEGKVLANYLLGTVARPALWDTLSRRHALPNAGVGREMFTMLVLGEAPTALTESLFLTNRAEAELLRAALDGTGTRIEEIAQGHLDGLLAYFATEREAPLPAEPSAPAGPVLLRELTYARVPAAGRRVALTFDDCNDAAAWAQILDVLEAERVTATFFCTTQALLDRPELTQRTARDGHTLGSHSYDHTRLTGLSLNELRGHFLRERAAWEELQRRTAVRRLPYFRPPFGAYDERMLIEAERAGFSRVVLWDVDSEDWRADSTQALARRVTDESRDGSIVLLHVIDIAAEALPSIVAGLRANALQPVDLEQLFHAADQR